MTDNDIGYAEAQRYPGGIEKFLFDKLMALETDGYDDTEIKADISALETAVGDNSSGLTKKVADVETAIGDEDTAASILGRIKALEDAS